MPSSAQNCCIRTPWWPYFPQITGRRADLSGFRILANERFVVCDRNIAPTFFDKITSLCAQAGFSPNIVQTSNLVTSGLILVEAGEGVTLLPSGLQHRRFNDLSFCPLIDPGSGIDLVMAWSPQREGETHKSSLDFMRSKKKFI